MPYAAGTLTVPSSPGTVSVAIPGAPALVVFQGTNFLDEDAVVTSSAHRAIFRGHCGRAYDDHSAVYQNSISIVADHAIERSFRNSKAVHIIHPGVSNTLLYEATCAFTTHGFDVDFTTAASGGYKVVWFAVYDNDNAVSLGTITEADLADANVGFLTRSILAYAQRSGSGGIDVTIDSQGTGMFSSVAANPATVGATIDLASCTSHNFPVSLGGQYATELEAVTGLTINFRLGQTPSFTPLTLQMLDWSLDIDGFLVSASTSADFLSGAILAWDEQSAAGGITPGDDAGDKVAITGLAINPGAVLFYGTSNLPRGVNQYALTNIRPIGYMLGIKCGRFEWCAVVETDGTDSVGGGASYQSFSKSWASAIQGPSDVNAGTTELTADGFIVTTVDDTFAASDIAWWCPAGGAIWLPHIYRVLPIATK